MGGESEDVRLGGPAVVELELRSVSGISLLSTHRFWRGAEILFIESDPECIGSYHAKNGLVPGL
jgi:hypothetical protein